MQLQNSDVDRIQHVYKISTPLTITVMTTYELETDAHNDSIIPTSGPINLVTDGGRVWMIWESGTIRSMYTEIPEDATEIKSMLIAAYEPPIRTRERVWGNDLGSCWPFLVIGIGAIAVCSLYKIKQPELAPRVSKLEQLKQRWRASQKGGLL